jgi:hypothetical protein
MRYSHGKKKSETCHESVSTHKCDMAHCVADERYKIQVTLLHYITLKKWDEEKTFLTQTSQEKLM